MPEDTARGRTVAAFDVDGTLTKRDCLRPFLQDLGGRRGLALAVLRRPVASLGAAAHLDRDALPEVIVGGVFAGRSVADVDRAGEQLAARVLAGGLRADTMARLRWHQRRGDAVVLVSASLGPYLRPLGRRLAVDGVLCADVVHDGARYSDRLAGENCRGAGKARRLTAWLAERGLDCRDLWVYGDSAGDRELLAMATHPVWARGQLVTAVPPAGNVFEVA
jgi:phosphatidylglycerophosphatase C